MMITFEYLVYTQKFLFLIYVDFSTYAIYLMLIPKEHRTHRKEFYFACFLCEEPRVQRG